MKSFTFALYTNVNANLIQFHKIHESKNLCKNKTVAILIITIFTSDARVYCLETANGNITKPTDFLLV